MKTALITHADCLDHVTPAGHPEQVARLEHVLHALAPLDLNRITAPLAADDDLLRIHPKSYIDEIKQMRPESGTFQVDADTHMSPGSVDAAYRAAGGTLRAVDMVLRVRQRMHSWQHDRQDIMQKRQRQWAFAYSETWHWAQNMPWIIMA